jgi:hypothetical protein
LEDFFSFSFIFCSGCFFPTKSKETESLIIIQNHQWQKWSTLRMGTKKPSFIGKTSNQRQLRIFLKSPWRIWRLWWSYCPSGWT